MQAPQALAKKASAFFVMFFLKMLYIKTYQANVLVLSLHVGKYREKQIFRLFKTQMIFVKKNPLHVLGSHENINLEGNSSCASSKIRLRPIAWAHEYMFFGASQSKKCLVLFRERRRRERRSFR